MQLKNIDWFIDCLKLNPDRFLEKKDSQPTLQKIFFFNIVRYSHSREEKIALVAQTIKNILYVIKALVKAILFSLWVKQKKLTPWTE